MKNLVLVLLAVSCSASAFAQGTVIFSNRIPGSLITHVYQPLAGNPYAHKIGNGANDTPSGTTDWAGYSYVGLNLNGPFGASTTIAALLSANGANQPESSLIAASQTSTFRTGGAAGNVTGNTATLGNVPNDSPAATFEMVAWDNSSGLYPTWNQASAAWLVGVIAAGVSGAFTVNTIGGTQNPAPILNGLQSFNLYFVPEPSTFALVGLGSAVALMLRRRK